MLRRLARPLRQPAGVTFPARSVAPRCAVRRIGKDARMTRSVLVTGGNRGIGLAIARAFAANGDKVTVTHRSSDPPSGLHGVRCDVTDPGQVEELFEAVDRQQGPIEVLVANAGITRDTLLLRMSEQDWDDVIDTTHTDAATTFLRGS